MACLETTFLIDLLRGKPEIKEFKDELDKSETLICIAAPSVMEIWNKITRLPQKDRINELISSCVILPLDEKSAKEAADIQTELQKVGAIIDLEDIMIAAIARSNGEKLVTRDEHYAKIKGLKILKY